MPALPRPFSRRPAATGTISTTQQSDMRPARRVIPPPAAVTRPAPSGRFDPKAPPSEPPAALAPRRTLMDRIFPVKPGVPEPPWTRVIGLIITMTVIWELIWFLTYYFAGPTAHNANATWLATAHFLPLALGFSALGSIPGFWLMRSRIRRANLLYDREAVLRRAQARPAPADETRSSRARRRHAAKKERGRRR